jgi:hypothetical protein
LLDEKELVDDKELPIDTYNYAALNDRLKKEGIQVSTTTIIKRAKSYGCYIPIRKSSDRHDREVITSSVGELIQHDASHHKWSPYADNKWVLITSLDDYSRMLMYADFVESETSWSHIQAAQYLSMLSAFHIAIMSIIYASFASSSIATAPGESWSSVQTMLLPNGVRSWT